MELLGCIPPWMSAWQNEDICYHDVEFNNIEQAQYVQSKLKFFVRQSYYTGIVDFESECKPDCTQTYLTVHKTKQDLHVPFNRIDVPTLKKQQHQH